MFILNEIIKRKKNQDLLSYFEYQVLKRIYHNMIQILREKLRKNGFSKLERDVFIKKYNLNINEAARKALDMSYYDLEVIEMDPHYLADDLYDHLPVNELYKND